MGPVHPAGTHDAAGITMRDVTVTDEDWRQPLPAVPDGVTAEVALEYLAYAQGNPALAAERMGLKSAEVLLGLLALDETIHGRAQAVFRFMQLASLLGALKLVEDMLLSQLEKLEPRDVAKTYTTMVAMADALTHAAASGVSAAGTNTNITFNLLRMLPPDVRDAMTALMPQASPLDAEPVNLRAYNSA